MNAPLRAHGPIDLLPDLQILPPSTECCVCNTRFENGDMTVLALVAGYGNIPQRIHAPCIWERKDDEHSSDH